MICVLLEQNIAVCLRNMEKLNELYTLIKLFSKSQTAKYYRNTAPKCFIYEV